MTVPWFEYAKTQVNFGGGWSWVCSVASSCGGLPISGKDPATDLRRWNG